MIHLYRPLLRFALLASLSLLPHSAAAGTLDLGALQQQIQQRADAFAEPVGVAVLDLANGRSAAINGEQHVPMASTFKAFLGVAVLDAVDRGTLTLAQPIHVRREDLSLLWQPLAQEVGDDGFDTTIGDLLQRAAGASDNAAADILLRLLGGPAAVQETLKQKGIRGLRIDRQERDFQTAIVGLRWHPEYVDAAVYASAVAAVPERRRAAAWQAYLADPRDSATPLGAVAALAALQAGNLLSPASTAHLLEIMTRTGTGKTRLIAGLPDGWQLAHKTGGGIEWRGRALSNNDIGILTAPDGHRFAVAVFIPDSGQSEARRDAFIADMARAVAARHLPSSDSAQ